jgi:hypothetical protein
MDLPPPTRCGCRVRTWSRPRNAPGADQTSAQAVATRPSAARTSRSPRRPATRPWERATLLSRRTPAKEMRAKMIEVPAGGLLNDTRSGAAPPERACRRSRRVHRLDQDDRSRRRREKDRIADRFAPPGQRATFDSAASPRRHLSAKGGTANRRFRELAATRRAALAKPVGLAGPRLVERATVQSSAHCRSPRPVGTQEAGRPTSSRRTSREPMRPPGWPRDLLGMPNALDTADRRWTEAAAVPSAFGVADGGGAARDPVKAGHLAPRATASLSATRDKAALAPGRPAAPSSRLASTPLPPRSRLVKPPAHFTGLKRNSHQGEGDGGSEASHTRASSSTR